MTSISNSGYGSANNKAEAERHRHIRLHGKQMIFPNSLCDCADWKLKELATWALDEDEASLRVTAKRDCVPPYRLKALVKEAIEL